MNHLEVGKHRVQIVAVDIVNSQRGNGLFVIITVRVLNVGDPLSPVHRQIAYNSKYGGLLSLCQAVLPHVDTDDEWFWWGLIDSVDSCSVTGRVLDVEVKEVRTKAGGVYLASTWKAVDTG